MEGDSIYCCGYTYQGRLFPLPADTWIGYWYNNNFYRADEYDLVQYPNIPVVMWTNAGMQQPPFGTYPHFMYKGQYFSTLTEAQSAKDQYQNYMYTVSAASYAPPPDPFSPTAATYSPGSQFAPRAQTVSGVYPAGVTSTVNAASPVRKPAVTRQCIFCKHAKSNFLTMIGKICCSDCLLSRYLNGNMTIGEGPLVIEWTAKMVAEVHTYLMNVLSEEDKAKMPQQIKNPPGSFVCVGRNEQVISNYPQQGHFSGTANQCAEGGCPNTHLMCKTCADKLSQCPLCNSFVEYEDLPIACPPDCDSHKPDFKTPCPKCKKVTPRRKQRIT